MSPLIEYLENWYNIVFYGRIAHPKGRKDRYTCYIFRTREDMKHYCQKNNLKCFCAPKDQKSYITICEDNMCVNLVGIHIAKVVIVSSYMPNLIEEICDKAISKNCDIVYESEVVNNALRDT